MADDGLFAAIRLVRRSLARLRPICVTLNEDSSVPVRTKELIALMVGWLNACDYCTCVHEAIALRLGIETQTLAQLGDFARSERFNDAERAALAATVSLTREPRALPPPVLEQLKRHYDEASSSRFSR